MNEHDQLPEWCNIVLGPDSPMKGAVTIDFERRVHLLVPCPKEAAHGKVDVRTKRVDEGGPEHWPTFEGTARCAICETAVTARYRAPDQNIVMSYNVPPGENWG